MCPTLSYNTVQYKLYFTELYRRFSQIEIIMKIFIKNDKKRILGG